jgi:hypothetical protein
MQPQTPNPLPATGMAVIDANGAGVGTVTAVQPPGTDVRPDVAVGIAEELMDAGYVRIDGSGFLTNDVYAGGDQIAGTSEVVTLGVRRDDLYRAG